MNKLQKFAKFAIPLAMIFAIVIMAIPAAAEIGMPDVPSDVPQTDDANALVGAIIKWILLIIGSVCVIMIIIGAIYMITDNGDGDRRGKGIGMLTWALIGLVIVILAWTIVAIIIRGATGLEV